MPRPRCLRAHPPVPTPASGHAESASCPPAPVHLQLRRAREDFAYMLKHMRGIKHDTTWEAAAELCGGEPEWRALEGEEERRAAFEEHVEKLKVGFQRSLRRE